ncbi:GNAT family N-acetyltransferase [uncultured Enterococcus sp.]|uniref:GNAT family N-acetyltransferase n=1 Tax=uncultured Enterococcus sp. TaxID=167972 RepID=UPI002AA7A4CB|nr:GNAT family N-acetyltransferase [uncultured Enterococcus sp.]
MKIEVLKKSDIIQYKALIDNCFGHSNNIDLYNKYEQNTAYTIFVAKDHGEIIGSVTQYAIDLFTFSFQPCLMLFNVAVKQEFRRQNVAQMLLREVISKARKQGYQSISLTCLDNAHAAHHLYESLGFEKNNSVKYSMDL